MATLRVRADRVLACALLTVGLVSGCASAVDGQGVGGSASTSLDRFPSQPVRSPDPSPSTAAPTVSPPTSATPTPTTSSPAPPPALDLTSLLEARPASARGWSTSWGHILRPTAAQFAKQFYPAGSRAEEVATLHAQGLTGIAHQTWVAKDSNQIDLILMGFDTADGALSRYLAVTAGTASRSDVTPFRIAGRPTNTAEGFRESGQDKYGYVRARAYARLAGSRIVLEAFFFSAGKFAKAEMIRWTDGQLKRLA